MVSNTSNLRPNAPVWTPPPYENPLGSQAQNSMSSASFSCIGQPYQQLTPEQYTISCGNCGAVHSCNIAQDFYSLQPHYDCPQPGHQEWYPALVGRSYSAYENSLHQQDSFTSPLHQMETPFYDSYYPSSDAKRSGQGATEQAKGAKKDGRRKWSSRKRANNDKKIAREERNIQKRESQTRGDGIEK